MDLEIKQMTSELKSIELFLLRTENSVACIPLPGLAVRPPDVNNPIPHWALIFWTLDFGPMLKLRSNTQIPMENMKSLAKDIQLQKGSRWWKRHESEVMHVVLPVGTA
ncbi:uncharacterized protein RCO7_14604 [Rhynchosporium graminicola]|uniref:Uncharacterized protein n=1 Tax=Rhynchosporium graminicola TaxID=2792576 RepID=A0A1E1KQW1_9HELO|nr:uncharacterized protein RCO7_14604 [Rhynchosporium commune]